MLIRPNVPSSILRVKEEIDQKGSLKVRPVRSLLLEVPELPVEAKAAAKVEAVKVGVLRGTDPEAVGANRGASLQALRRNLQEEDLKGKIKAL